MASERETEEGRCKTLSKHNVWNYCKDNPCGEAGHYLSNAQFQHTTNHQKEQNATKTQVHR